MVEAVETPGGRKVKEVAAPTATGTAPKVRKKRPTAAEKQAALEALGPAVRLKSLKSGFTASEDGYEIRVVTAASPLPVPVIRFVQHSAAISTMTRARFSAAQINAFDDILDEVRAEEYTPVKVDSLMEFFDGEKRFQALLATETAQERVILAGAVGLEISLEEAELVDRFVALKQRFLDHFRKLRPRYPFAKKKSGDRKIRVSSDLSEFTWNSNYTISQRQAKMLWERCFKHWSGQANDSGTGTFQYSRTDRNIRITDTELTIGCQTVPRWSVEQLAVQMGWISV